MKKKINALVEETLVLEEVEQILFLTEEIYQRKLLDLNNKLEFANYEQSMQIQNEMRNIYKEYVVTIRELTLLLTADIPSN